MPIVYDSYGQQAPTQPKRADGRMRRGLRRKELMTLTVDEGICQNVKKTCDDFIAKRLQAYKTKHGKDHPNAEKMAKKCEAEISTCTPLIGKRAFLKKGTFGKPVRT